jgi:hypothetical protein
MNEKIRELISQSYEYAVVTTVDPFTQEVVTDYIDGTKPIFNKEKFAELIVEECIGVVEGGRFLHDQAPTALFAKECSGAIKRHFGVEE